MDWARSSPLRASLARIERAPEVLRCRQQADEWVTVTLAYLGFRKIQFPYVLRLRGMPPAVLHEIYDLKTFWQIFLHQCYRVEPTDRVIVDAGANIGLFSLFACRVARKARILAIEPFPATFDRLVQLIRVNGLSDRVRCVNAALCASDVPRVMRGTGPSQMHFVAPAESAASGIAVMPTTLPQVLEMAREPVDLLKMDIEGSEYEVFPATPPDLLRTIRRIVVEYHGSPEPEARDALFETLRTAGFKVRSDERDAEGYGVAEFVQVSH
jgi:FkbM family methyltransferase